MTRTALPNRRDGDLFTFEHNGIVYHGHVSRRLEDGRPLEVFLEGGKVGSPVQAIARDTAVAASLGLQFGLPLETLRHALTRSDDGTPAGPLGTLLDLIAADMKQEQPA